MSLASMGVCRQFPSCPHLLETFWAKKVHLSGAVTQLYMSWGKAEAPVKASTLSSFSMLVVPQKFCSCLCRQELFVPKVHSDS